MNRKRPLDTESSSFVTRAKNQRKVDIDMSTMKIVDTTSAAHTKQETGKSAKKKIRKACTVPSHAALNQCFFNAVVKEQSDLREIQLIESGIKAAKRIILVRSALFPKEDMNYDKMHSQK